MRLYPAIVLILATAACRERAESPAQTAGTATAASADQPTPPRITSPDSSFYVLLPARWAGSYRVDTLAAAERAGARPGALNIVYQPQDSTIIPQTLVVVTVYDAAAWTRARVAGGPPPGDSVAFANNRVYVLAFPQSNPFPPGSPDAVKFDALALAPEEKARFIGVP